jgi:6-phospho-3-hexuloisomerase
MDKIFKELQHMWDNTENVETYIQELINHKGIIVGIGAGRMGYSLRAHIMRLSHIGYETYFIGDTSTPRIDKNSLVIINTSSGETPTNILYAQQAKEAGSKIITVTCNEKSSIGKLSDVVVKIPTMTSHQLMKTIYEQYTYLLFDYISENVVAKQLLNRDIITHNHSILE